MKCNNDNKGCGVDMNVCDRNIDMLPMLQTYTTKLLKPNMQCGKNILTQSMMACENHKYVICWDFDLGGKTITVPENCILEFDGGSLDNGTVIGQDTVFVNVGDVEIWGVNLVREGTWKDHSGGGGDIQDAFGKVRTGEDVIEAKGNDTLGIEAGENVNIEADPETKKITISADLSAVSGAIDAESRRAQDKESSLQGQIDAIVAGGASVSLSASPSTVFVGVQSSISLSATTDTEASSIKIRRNGTDIASGSGLSLSYTDAVTPSAAGSVAYSAKFTIAGSTRTASKNVTAVYPIKYGAGDDYTDANNQASARTTPAGTYNVTVPDNGDYVFFVVPRTMNISRATMSGFDFPLQAPVDVDIEGVAYKYYKSSNTYDAGILTIVIS